jgi:hypothetical protein
MFFLQTYFRGNYFAIIKSFRPKFLTKLLCKPFFKEIALRGNDFATIKNIGYHFHNHTFLLYTNFYQGRQCRSRVINKHTHSRSLSVTFFSRTAGPVGLVLFLPRSFNPKEGSSREKKCTTK